jgi:hypothetical protein
MKKLHFIPMILALFLIHSCQVMDQKNQSIEIPLVENTRSVPSETFTVSKTQTPTHTPTHTITPTAIILASTTPNEYGYYIPGYQPSCDVLDGFYKCTDSILGITFEYPQEWGILSVAIEDKTDWYAYYHKVSSRMLSGAGFSSPNYSRYSYLGFEGKSAEEVCQRIEGKTSERYISICEVINENVVISYLFYGAGCFCYSSSACLYDPHANILVDLQKNKDIDAFRYSIILLSLESLYEYYDQVDLIIGKNSENCTPSTISELNNWINSYIESLFHGDGNAETLLILESIKQFAKSIEVLK